MKLELDPNHTSDPHAQLHHDLGVSDERMSTIINESIVAVIKKHNEEGSQTVRPTDLILELADRCETNNELASVMHIVGVHAAQAGCPLHDSTPFSDFITEETNALMEIRG